jgi:hypothetical protein
MDYDEHSPLRDAYRAHLRAMTEARQAAEKAKKAHSRDPDARTARAQIYKQEMARIDAAHQQWLREHHLIAPTTRAQGGALPK